MSNMPTTQEATLEFFANHQPVWEEHALEIGITAAQATALKNEIDTITMIEIMGIIITTIIDHIIVIHRIIVHHLHHHANHQDIVNHIFIMGSILGLIFNKHTIRTFVELGLEYLIILVPILLIINFVFNWNNNDYWKKKMTNRKRQIMEKGYLGPSNMTFVPKIWGYELWITNNEKYCGKILFIKRGKQCSFHEHKIKDEVLYVKSGVCEFRIHDPEIHLEKEEDKFVLNAGDAWHVTPGIIHQMTAITDVEIIEISTQHFDSDSYRQKE